MLMNLMQQNCNSDPITIYGKTLNAAGARITIREQEQHTDFYPDVPNFNCLVISLEQKKGCVYASLLVNVYIDIANRIPKLK